MMRHERNLEEVKVGACKRVDPSALASLLADAATATQVEADKGGRILVYQLDAYHSVLDLLGFVSLTNRLLESALICCNHY